MHPDRTRKKKEKTQLMSVIAHSRFLFLSTDFGKLTRDLRLFRESGESVIALIFMQFSFFDEPRSAKSHTIAGESEFCRKSEDNTATRTASLSG